MRTRIAATVVGAVIVSLLLAGLGTLVLSRAATQRNAMDALEDQADALAELVAVAATPRQDEARQAGSAAPLRIPRAALRRVSQALEVRDVGLEVITREGRRLGSLPDGLELSPAQQEAVRDGSSVAGRDGRTLYAAAGRTLAAGGAGDASAAGNAGGRVAVVIGLTADSEPLLGDPFGWFLLSSAAVIALSTVAGLWVAGRLARPVSEAGVAAERIAAGDLSVRLETPAPGDRSEPAVLARSVNAMAAALERSRGLEQQFLLSISHDLRTPLTNVRGYAEAIADGAAEDPRAAAEVILTEAGRLDRLVRDLLDLGRLEARQFALHPRAADLAAEVAAAAEAFRAELHTAGITLDVHSAGAAEGVADVDRLAQVVANLVSNARRYARSVVRVRIDSEQGCLRFTVSDDGPGIAAEDLPHVFERLYQAREQPTRTESGGGLGLAIVSELVSAMGGEVAVSSSAGEGTTFSVRLPLDSPPSAD